MVVFKKRIYEIQFKNAFLFWKTPEYNYKTTTVLQPGTSKTGFE
jgi:hypothetical protein